MSKISRGSILENTNFSFSLLGAGSAGQAVCFMWPAHMWEEEHIQVVAEGLDALDQVARPALESFTRLLDIEEIGEAVLMGLEKMGVDSPFKLDDGTVVSPGGEGSLNLDPVQDMNGDFRIWTAITFADLNEVRGVRPDGREVVVSMNPDTVSWAEVQCIVHMSPDARLIKIEGLPQFRHRFDVKELTTGSPS
ncbi:MAG: hypothetical protein ACN6OC_06485 [Alcaligenes sp.]